MPTFPLCWRHLWQQWANQMCPNWVLPQYVLCLQVVGLLISQNTSMSWEADPSELDRFSLYINTKNTVLSLFKKTTIKQMLINIFTRNRSIVFLTTFINVNIRFSSMSYRKIDYTNGTLDFYTNNATLFNKWKLVFKMLINGYYFSYAFQNINYDTS
jgi:hypothetical protein